MSEELITSIFSVMGDYRMGQVSNIFRARATELSHLVLTDNNKHTTCFVRSLVRGMQAYLRNLPTLINIMSQEYEVAVLERRNTQAWEVLVTMTKLQDSRKLLLVVGLAQLLELVFCCKPPISAQPLLPNSGLVCHH